MAALDQLFNGILPFVHTAEERSFRRAATRLGVTPAAVSKAVAKLEDELGARLLVRTSRHVSLTAEGAQFLERCRVAIASMQRGSSSRNRDASRGARSRSPCRRSSAGSWCPPWRSSRSGTRSCPSACA